MLKKIAVSLVAFTLFLSCLDAQQLVSATCEKRRLASDSIMRVVYGDQLSSYFSLDTSMCRVRTDKRKMLGWNDTLYNESVIYCHFSYYFQFPGAMPTSFFHPPIVEDTGIYMLPFQRSFPKYTTIIGPVQMDSITRRWLDKPLSECEVSIYTEKAVGTDDKPIPLDPSHVYFMVASRKVTVDEGKKYTTTTTSSEVLVVDGCTGFVPEKPSKVETQWTSPTRSK